MSNGHATITNKKNRRVAILRSVSSLWLRLQRLWTLQSRTPANAPAVYYSEIKSMSAEQWRAAFAEDPALAARWVYAAAMHGEIQAQLLWGHMLLDGYTAERDPDGAFRWVLDRLEKRTARCHQHGRPLP